MSDLMTLTRRGALGLAVAAMTWMTAPTAAVAQASPAAEKFVEGVVADLRSLVNNGRSGEAGAREFLSLLERTSAVEAVSRFAVGRSWREMSAAQQASYAEAYRLYISRTYQNRFGEYNGEDIVVTGSVDAGKKGTLVKSTLKRPAAEDVALEWLVDDRSGRLLVSDVIFEGVSLAISLRETFAGMIEKRNGDIDAFIADLRASQGA